MTRRLEACIRLTEKVGVKNKHILDMVVHIHGLLNTP